MDHDKSASEGAAAPAQDQTALFNVAFVRGLQAALTDLSATLAARDAALQEWERLADDRWLTIQRLTSQHNDWKAQAERAEVALRACQEQKR